jgi:DNA-binding response OmpR family regulator
MPPTKDRAPDGTGGRVLVVEDDAHILDLVMLHLELEGLTPVPARTGL